MKSKEEILKEIFDNDPLNILVDKNEHLETMNYYQCMFTAIGGAYSVNKYDLPTDNEQEIIEILKADGYEVLEVYDIKKQ